MPGLSDFQLYSIATNHFNQEIPNDANTHEKLTKLKHQLLICMKGITINSRFMINKSMMSGETQIRRKAIKATLDK